MKPLKYDFLIIGAGVIGLATGISLLRQKPNSKVIIVEKEDSISKHASGRNSGVLHAGFYYSPDSLKAEFCRKGNLEIRSLAKKYQIPIKNTGKVVVACNKEEVSQLENLYQRGVQNKVDIEILDQSKLYKIEPLAKTFEKFLWSPTTGVSDPIKINHALMQEFLSLGGEIEFGKRLTLQTKGGQIIDAAGVFDAKIYINSAGSQANLISKNVGAGQEYLMIPFLGTYHSTDFQSLPLKTLVYPVPHPVNPFLGIHFTISINNKIKIGPSAIPILGREQYTLVKGWSIPDAIESFRGLKSLVRSESHNVMEVLKSEVPKIFVSNMVRNSSRLVPDALMVNKWKPSPSGIRAQLIDKRTGNLVQDFLVSKHLNSVHILNAVSPGWTSALPFGRHVANVALGI